MIDMDLPNVPEQPEDAEHKLPAVINTREIMVNQARGELVTYTIYDDIKGKRAKCSQAIISIVPIKKSNIILAGNKPDFVAVATILFVWTRPEIRRKGYGQNIVQALKQHFPAIYAEPLTSEFKKLLMACGFTRVKDKELFRWVNK